MSTPPLTRRQTEIADAAIGLVATRGIAALTARTLAAEVGVTSGALFRHWPTMDALLVGVATRAVELLHGTFPDEALPPIDSLARFVRARLALVEGRAGVLQLVLSEQFGLALPEEARRLLRAAVADTRAFLARVLARGQAERHVRADVSADGLALLFVGALQGAALARRVGGAGALDVLDVLDVLVRPTHPQEAP